jgi:hypothetical protein
MLPPATGMKRPTMDAWSRDCEERPWWRSESGDEEDEEDTTPLGSRPGTACGTPRSVASDAALDFGCSLLQAFGAPPGVVTCSHADADAVAPEDADESFLSGFLDRRTREDTRGHKRTRENTREHKRTRAHASSREDKREHKRTQENTRDKREHKITP